MKSLTTNTRLEIPEEVFEKIVDADIAFHRQICVMSHNELLLNAYDMAKEPIKRYVKSVLMRRILTRLEKQQDIASIRDIHNDIYIAMLNRDYEKCVFHYNEMIDREIDL